MSPLCHQSNNILSFLISKIHLHLATDTYTEENLSMMKIYQLWGPLSDFEKSLCGIWGAKTASEDPVKSTLDFESELNSNLCNGQDDSSENLEDMDLLFDRAVKPPKSTSPDSLSHQVEVHFSLNLNCFADWASSLSDDHYTDLCSWAADLEAH
ncbi:hypothetical protein AALO_G00307450 [Alosa alosa]|uniref:Uncharacterized protein n=1 Tax=Alosa alosa TaxID=278164 RepID=A0AAV6FCV4_9TELE|nr:hypothetical protein AALO_G00307450 [Alosa alosa]